MMKTKKILLTTAGVAVALSMATSCGLYKKYETPTDNAMTRAYVEARQGAATDSAAFGNLLWEQVFTDPVLADYINRALANNHSIADARLNIEQARTQLKGAKLAYFPSVALAPNGAGASYAGSDMSWSYQIPLSVSWEVDVFGKLLNNKRSAAVGVDIAEAQAQAVRSQIISTVANTYYSLASIEAQLALARNTARLWSESVQVMRDLKEAGRLNEAAVVQSDANYRSVLASISDLEMRRTQISNAMSTLLGTMPGDWAVSPDATIEVPSIVLSGVPMNYLANRPDVAIAERGLASAYYATNSARAAFYPGLNITANGGFTNLLGSMIKNPGDWFVQLAGSLTAPLFSRGQNIARLEAAKIGQQRAMVAFESKVLSAAAEVSNALTTIEKSAERAQHLDAQVADLEKSVDYTNDLLIYSNGTYLEVLTAQQGLLQAQMNKISNQLTRAQAVINLYQAVGGGR